MVSVILDYLTADEPVEEILRQYVAALYSAADDAGTRTIVRRCHS